MLLMVVSLRPWRAVTALNRRRALAVDVHLCVVDEVRTSVLVHHRIAMNRVSPARLGPFQVGPPDVAAYKEMRKQFTTDEWAGVMLQSAGYAAAAFPDRRSRMLLFARMLPSGLPELASFDWRAGLIAVGAALLLFRFSRGVLLTLALAALAGLGLSSL